MAMKRRVLHGMLFLALLGSPLTAQLCGACSPLECLSTVESLAALDDESHGDSEDHCSAAEETTSDPAPASESCCSTPTMSGMDGCFSHSPAAVTGSATDGQQDLVVDQSITAGGLAGVVAALSVTRVRHRPLGQPSAPLFTLHSTYLI